MEGYKYEVQVELTPGDPVISAQVCLERKWGTQGNLNTNTATVTSLDVWSDIFFYFEFGSLSVTCSPTDCTGGLSHMSDFLPLTLGHLNVCITIYLELGMFA